MEDFNGAMKALEDSLTANRENAYRQAHNVLLLSEALGYSPAGGATQTMKGSGLPEGASGLVAQGTSCWASTGSAATTAAQLAAAIKPSQSLTMVKGEPANCKPMVAEFTALGPGKLTCLTLSGSYTGNEGCTGQMRVTMKNETLGEVEAQEEGQMYWRGSSASGTFYLRLSMTFRGGCRYRIEVIGLEEKYNCVMAYSSSGLTAEAVDAPSGTVACTLPEAGETGGLAIARYASVGEGGGLTLSWGGKTYPPTAVRGMGGPDGIQVAEFRASGPIPAGSRAELMLRSPVDGCISLYGWGAIVI